MITEEMIPRIEQAFGFRLHDWQKDYLLGNPCDFPSEDQRQAGVSRYHTGGWNLQSLQISLHVG